MKCNCFPFETKNLTLHKGIHSNYKKGKPRCATIPGIRVGLLSGVTKTIHPHLDERIKSKSVVCFMFVMSFINKIRFLKTILSTITEIKPVPSFRKVNICVYLQHVVTYIFFTLLFITSNDHLRENFCKIISIFSRRFIAPQNCSCFNSPRPFLELSRHCL